MFHGVSIVFVVLIRSFPSPFSAKDGNCRAWLRPLRALDCNIDTCVIPHASPTFRYCHDIEIGRMGREGGGGGEGGNNQLECWRRRKWAGWRRWSPLRRVMEWWPHRGKSGSHRSLQRMFPSEKRSSTASRPLWTPLSWNRPWCWPASEPSRWRTSSSVTSCSHSIAAKNKGTIL